MASSLEQEFDCLASLFRLPEAEHEYGFAREIKRKWRFDRAFPAHRVAVELEGGVWTQGRHTRGAGFSKDCEKLNAATILGWRVLRFTSDMLKKDPGGCMEMLEGLLKGGA